MRRPAPNPESDLGLPHLLLPSRATARDLLLFVDGTLQEAHADHVRLHSLSTKRVVLVDASSCLFLL
jgi:hypothetical protein